MNSEASDVAGIKWDNGKLRWDLIPFDELEKVVGVITYGANKYDDNNWQGVAIKRYQAAAFRHLSAYMKGEMVDVESGHEHLAHAACNLLFLMFLERKAVDKP